MVMEIRLYKIYTAQKWSVLLKFLSSLHKCIVNIRYCLFSFNLLLYC